MKKNESEKEKKPHNRIAELRKDRGLTIQQVADGIGVSNGTISRYEKGTREPKLETWVKLADFFGVSVPYLQGISNYINSETSPKGFDDFLKSAASKVDTEGNALFTETDWRNFVTSFTSQEALNNFRKLYIVINQLDVPINKIKFDEILKNIDSLTELNYITENVAYVYEILVKGLIYNDDKIKKAAKNIMKIVTDSYYDEDLNNESDQNKKESKKLKEKYED